MHTVLQRGFSRQPALAALALVMALSGGGALATTAADVGECAGTLPSQTFDITPATPNYQNNIVDNLQAGDLLRLGPGTYTSGLSITDLSGARDDCIIIEGPASGAAAILTGSSSANTIRIRRSHHVVIRNLELDGNGMLGDGVKGEGDADNWAHHITLENLYIHGHGADQQIVGINTKCEAWNWVIRRNVIEGAGTGIYLGDSNGEDEFFSGLIEHNLIVDTVGYNMQIKHQNDRTLPAPFTSTNGVTTIRHNVFSKENSASTGGDARPNLLVGQFPASGTGSDDDYLIYGNFFWQNGGDGEPLFQGTGNVIFYDNLLVNDVGPGIGIQFHQGGTPQRIRIFQNTIVTTGTGLSITSRDPAYTQRVVGNAVFAPTQLNLTLGVTDLDNVTDTRTNAAAYLVNPPLASISGAVDRLDLYPLSGTVMVGSVDQTGLSAYEDWNRDFNGTARTGFFRGAYAGTDTNPGWMLALERKPENPGDIFRDSFETGNTDRWSASIP